MEDNQLWRYIFWWKTTVDRRWPLMEDDLPCKMTFQQRSQFHFSQMGRKIESTRKSFLPIWLVMGYEVIFFIEDWGNVPFWGCLLLSLPSFFRSILTYLGPSYPLFMLVLLLSVCGRSVIYWYSDQTAMLSLATYNIFNGSNKSFLWEKSYYLKNRNFPQIICGKIKLRRPGANHIYFYVRGKWKSNCLLEEAS